MKLAIATNDGQKIDAHVGKANQFLVYTIDDGQIKQKEIRKNSDCLHKDSFGKQHRNRQHCKGRERGKQIMALLDDCDTLVAQGMGSKLREKLRIAGINTFIASEETIDDVLKKYSE